MSPQEARQLMLKHCISFADLARACAMVEPAIRKHVTRSRGELPHQLAETIRGLSRVRPDTDTDRAEVR